MNNQLVSSITVFLLIFCCAITTEAQWTPDPFCPFPSDHVTRYPYYGNCSVFWECYNGAKYTMQCPEGLEFNAPQQECDAPEIANCDPYASTTSNPDHTTEGSTSTRSSTSSTSHGTTTAPTVAPHPECPNNETVIYYPYPGNCAKYWECYEGKAYLYTCPSPLWWHQEITNCDYPGSYCDNSTTITPPTTHPTSTSSSTEITTQHTDVPTTSGDDPRCSQGGTSYWPQPGDCHRYVECIDTRSYIVECPQNLFFSDHHKECVPVDQSECCKVYECNPITPTLFKRLFSFVVNF